MFGLTALYKNSVVDILDRVTDVPRKEAPLDALYQCQGLINSIVRYNEISNDSPI